jgi:hypothetical protein
VSRKSLGSTGLYNTFKQIKINLYRKKTNDYQLYHIHIDNTINKYKNAGKPKLAIYCCSYTYT